MNETWAQEKKEIEKMPREKSIITTTTKKEAESKVKKETHDSCAFR